MSSDVSEYLSRKLNKTLFPFQLQAVRKAVEENGKLILNHGTGLGKSITSLSIIYYYFKRFALTGKGENPFPLLITCQVSKLEEWFETVRSVFEIQNTKCIFLRGKTKSKDVAKSVEEAQFVITSHQSLSSPEIAGRRFHAIVIDESHLFQRESAQRSRFLRSISILCHFRILLTGTLIKHSPPDLFFQLHLVRPEEFTTCEQFCQTFFDVQFESFIARGGVRRLRRQFREKNTLDPKRIELEKRLSRVVSRVLYDQVMDEIVLADTEQPFRKIVQRRMIYLNHLSEKEKTEIEQAEAETAEEKKTMHAKFLNDPNGERFARLKLYQRMSTLVARIKKTAVARWIKEELPALLTPEENRVALFSEHVSFHGEICDALSSLDISYIRIDGSVQGQKRAKQLQIFQRGGAKAAVLSIRACGTGIDLTIANIVVVCEIPADGVSLEQVESRLARIGQRKPVQVFLLMLRCAHEKREWRRVVEKVEDAAFILDGGKRTSALSVIEYDNSKLKRKRSSS